MGSKELHEWYHKLRPLTVDIVGDFAGRELFAIHGESLIRYCLIEARVDFDGKSLAWSSLNVTPCLILYVQKVFSFCMLCTPWRNFSAS